MKKNLAILFLFPVMVFGQETIQNNDNSFPIIKHEFGLNMYSMTDMHLYLNMRHWDDHQDQVVTNSFFTGVYYKYYLSKNGLRSSFDYFHGLINMEDQWQYVSYKDVIETKSVEIKLGYERLFAVKKYIPYAFSDILYSYGQSKSSLVVFDASTGEYDYLSGKFADQELGISFGIGFKYRPIKNLSIGIETSLQSVYNNFWRMSEPTNKYYGFNFYWNPVRILSIGLTL